MDSLLQFELREPVAEGVQGFLELFLLVNRHLRLAQWLRFGLRRLWLDDCFGLRLLLDWLELWLLDDGSHG